MKLEVTKEKVLEAAEKCSQAKETLKTLFPECFEKELPIFPNGVSIKISGDRAIENRLLGSDDYNSNVLWLSDLFEWEIKKAKNGGYLLIANHK